MYKILFLILFISGFAKFSLSQSLITNFPQLNVGGYINDVWEDTLANKIYIAGNFTSVNGSARKNLARLNYNPILNSYSVDAWAPITAMTGEIKCLAKYNDQLHIGGNFTSINGNAIYANWSVINIISATLGTFQPDAGGSTNEITDFVLDGNNLYVAGTNTIYDSGTAGRFNLAVFDVSTATPTLGLDPLTLNPSFNWGGSMEAVRLHLSGNRIYLCGRNFGGTLNDGIVAFDKTTLLQINSFNPSFTFEQVIDCESYNGKVYIVNSKIWPGGESVLEIDETTGAVTAGAFNVSSGGTPYSISRYKNYLYIAGTYNFFQTQAQNYLGSVNLDSPSLPRAIVNWVTSPNVGFDNHYALSCWRNKLYVSDNNLTNIAATAKNGMAAFCMEPYDPQILTTATANVCPSQTFSYTIQAVQYATGYTWWYTGTNATITGNGTASISIAFDETATSGTLYVSPYSKCNLYSDTLSYSITVNPRPNANAGIDSTLNCERLNLNLQGNSTSSPVSYQWNGPSGFNSSTQNPNITLDGNYILTVTNTLTNCTQKDTVTITQDTIKPDVILPISPFTLTCKDTTILLDGNSLTNPTTFYWLKQSTGTIYPDPFYADSIGAYFLVVTNTRNGCKDSNYVTVGENRIAPQIEISSHPGITTLIIDTLTCFNDTILVSGSSTTPNTIFHWEDTSSVLGNNDTLYLTISAAYSLFVTDTINGCSSQQNFFIDEFVTPPQISLPTGMTSITCSNDTITLDGDAITANTNLNWTDPGNFSSIDPALADTVGYFILTGIRTDNGCVVTDSVFVTQIPLIETMISNDTLVCAGSNVDLWVNVIGNFTSLNYSWTGTAQTTSIVSVFPFITTQYFVTVTDGNGCTGFDSVTVNIPSPVTDSILTFASCDSTIGEIQIYATGGISPYSYSIDNGNTFQSSNIFNVSFGDYEIIIQDSLGCFYTDSATVSENSQLPEPDFLVSTYSFLGDTLVMINISNPQPDSLEWVFPFNTNVILNNAETPWIILPDTGSFQIILKGIYSNCYAEKIKTVYVRQPDSTIASFYNQNGIDTLSIYPNPNNGIFDLEITLFRKQDFSILIYDLQGNRHFDSFVSESDYHLQNIQLSNLPNGTYMLRVIAEFDARTVYFIIQQ